MVKRKYKHRNLITRTISTTSGDVLYFDADEKGNKTVYVTIQGKVNEAVFLKKASKNIKGIVLAVENVTTNERLYGITLENFLANAEEITDQED